MRPRGVCVFVEAKFAADFDFGCELAGLIEGELVDSVIDLLGGFDYGLVDVGADFAGLAVHLGAHVFLGLVVLAGGERDGVLHGSDDDAGFDSFVATQGLN